MQTLSACIYMLSAPFQLMLLTIAKSVLVLVGAALGGFEEAAGDILRV